MWWYGPIQGRIHSSWLTAKWGSGSKLARLAMVGFSLSNKFCPWQNKRAVWRVWYCMNCFQTLELISFQIFVLILIFHFYIAVVLSEMFSLALSLRFFFKCTFLSTFCQWTKGGGTWCCMLPLGVLQKKLQAVHLVFLFALFKTS